MNRTPGLVQHLWRGRLLLVLAILTVGLCGRTGSALAQTRLRIGYEAVTITSAPMHYAATQGLFKKHGLDVDLVLVESGAVMAQAMIGGSVDIAQNGYTGSIAAAAAGADIVVFGGISNRLPFMLLVNASIQQPGDLKGKRIAIARLGGQTEAAARIAVDALGLRIEDTDLIQVGGETARTAAFINGRVDATLSQLPFAEILIGAGARVAVDLGTASGDYPTAGFITSRGFLMKNPEAVKRFLMAMAEAVADFRTKPEAAAQVTARFLGMEPTDAVRRAVGYYGANIFQQDLRTTRAGLSAVLREVARSNPAAASTPVDTLIDESVLDHLDAEGFFKRLH